MSCRIEQVICRCGCVECEKLRSFGLTPPRVPAEAAFLHLQDPVECPRCASLETELRNAFGSTPCRTIHYCRSCQTPFEGFKPL